jgi:hypothetical protein
MGGELAQCCWEVEFNAETPKCGEKLTGLTGLTGFTGCKIIEWPIEIVFFIGS